MAGVARKVELNVLTCQGNGLLAAVDAMYELGTATHGIDGEASGIAEHVQYAFAGCVFFK